MVSMYKVRPSRIGSSQGLVNRAAKSTVDSLISDKLGTYGLDKPRVIRIGATLALHNENHHFLKKLNHRLAGKRIKCLPSIQDKFMQHWRQF